MDSVAGIQELDFAMTCHTVYIMQVITCPKSACIKEGSRGMSLCGKSPQGAQAHHKVLLWSPPVKRCLPSGVKHKQVTRPV